MITLNKIINIIENKNYTKLEDKYDYCGTIYQKLGYYKITTNNGGIITIEHIKEMKHNIYPLFSKSITLFKRDEHYIIRLFTPEENKAIKVFKIYKNDIEFKSIEQRYKSFKNEIIEKKEKRNEKYF